MRLGTLDQRVIIQQKTTTRADNGEDVVTWQDVATVWAKVTPLRGRELFAAMQMQQAIDIRVNIRYRSDVEGDMRLLWRGKPLDIVGPPVENGRKEFLELMCVSGIRDGR